MGKRNVFDEAAELTEFWSQRVLTSANGNLFKVAKGIGATNWHTHDDQDETFLVLSGRLTIQLRDGDVDLGPGDLYAIPRGTEHCPQAAEEVRFLLVGPEVTSNAAGGKPDWSFDDGRPDERAGDAIDDPGVRQQTQHRMAEIGIDPAAVARAVAFAIEQPDDVEIGDMTIRPTVQN